MPERKNESERELVISRIINAPRELVWQAWTSPAHVVNWWGPVGFTTTIEEMDVRPGGVWKQTMHGPDGTNYPNKSIFKEVVKPERIVYSHAGGKEKGPGIHFESVWTFEERGPDKTEVTIRHIFKTKEDRDLIVREFKADEGGKQTLGRLDELLKRMQSFGKVGQEFTFTRLVNAKRDLVFQAWTDPKILVRWWGPHGYRNKIHKMEVRPGGALNIEMIGPDGTGHPMLGTFEEIRKPEKLVFKSAATDPEGHPLFQVLTTVRFTQQNEKTLVSVNAKVIETSDKAAPYLSGIEAGWSQTLERLAAECEKAS